MKEPWVGGEDLTSRLLFAIISHLNEFERDCLIDRTRAGLASARAKGKVGGRKPIKQNIIDNAITLYENNKAINVTEICTIFKISRKTLYKYINLKNKQIQQIQRQEQIQQDQQDQKEVKNISYFLLIILISLVALVGTNLYYQLISTQLLFKISQINNLNNLNHYQKSKTFKGIKNRLWDFSKDFSISFSLYIFKILRDLKDIIIIYNYLPRP